MLKETFLQLFTNYTDDHRLINELWTEVEEHYSHKKRHYHTLSHLYNLLLELTEIKSRIKCWNTILFTMYYHDIVYNVLKANNEELSAEFAEKRMKQITVKSHLIENSISQILATKNHLADSASDTNYFTDADLSVLGQGWQAYSMYCQHVRKEYSIYPDMIYMPGRKKVLKHFLAMERIYKTDYFYNKYEAQARQNIALELAQL